MADKRPTNAETYKTAYERARAFYQYCDGRDCDKCPINDRRNAIGRDNDHVCLAFWLELESSDTHPLGCPFCGFSCSVEKTKDEDFGVFCKDYSCNYSSAKRKTPEEAVDAHNGLVLLVSKARGENG